MDRTRIDEIVRSAVNARHCDGCGEDRPFDPEQPDRWSEVGGLHYCVTCTRRMAEDDIPITQCFMSSRSAAAFNSAQTNGSCPLRRVVGLTPNSWGSWFEMLECGHKGRVVHAKESWESYRQYVPSKRRRCTVCRDNPEGPCQPPTP